MKISCPGCSAIVPARNVSLERGWAKCESCQNLFPLDGVLPNFVLIGPTKPAQRPFDARVLVDKSDRYLVVLVPARGLGIDTVSGLVFMIFWLGFVAFWTAGAMGLFSEEPPELRNWCFASFSIPFWLVGLTMLAKGVFYAWGTSSVHIDLDRMVTQDSCLGLSRTRKIERRLIQHARPRGAQATNNSTQRAPGVEIVYEGGSFTLPVGSEEEEGWLLGQINGFLNVK
jgi:hypothetical protein